MGPFVRIEPSEVSLQVDMSLRIWKQEGGLSFNEDTKMNLAGQSSEGVGSSEAHFYALI